MKNPKLSILSLLCVSLLAITLPGCGKDATTDNTTTEKVTTEEKATTKENSTTEATSKEDSTNEAVNKTYEENSLIAYYSFDNSNNFILDDSGNNLKLTSLGTRYNENGKKNGGVYFDGSSAGLALPSDVFQASGFTFACWINLDEDLPFARVLNAGDTVKYFFLITSNNNDTYNEWAHLAFTLQDGTAKLYYNGSLVAEYTGINYTMADFAQAGTYLGRSGFDTDPSLKGYMDEVYFYNYALDDTAITELMNK